jgi:hypothetical protein
MSKLTSGSKFEKVIWWIISIAIIVSIVMVPLLQVLIK